MSSGTAADRALMARLYHLVESTDDCERCGKSADIVLEIGVVEDGAREIATCLPCGLDLLVMLHRKGRLVRE